MNQLIEIDTGKCIGCGICVAECPSKVIILQERKATIITPRNCISCGHCAALCSVSAITCSINNNVHPFTIEEIDPSLIRPEQIVFHQKRSNRVFTSKEIRDEDLQKLVEYAEKAPSAHNNRTRKYIILRRPEIEKVLAGMMEDYHVQVDKLSQGRLLIVKIFNRKKYDELSIIRRSLQHALAEYEKKQDRIFRDAPYVVCIAASTGDRFSRDDCIASQHYLMLYGKTIKIDSFIVGYAQAEHKVIEKIVGIEEGYSIYAISAFGYGKYYYNKEVIYRGLDYKIL
jgi:ferredoxin